MRRFPFSTDDLSAGDTSARKRLGRTLLGTTAAILIAGTAGSVFAETQSAKSNKPAAPAAAAPAAATAPASAAPRQAAGPQSFAALVQRVSPAVVTIISYKDGKPFGTGSGFVIESKGLILTNEHVIHNANKVEVRFANGERMFARRAASDISTDLAVLWVEAAKPLPSVELGDENKVRVGDWVIAIGSPVGLSGSVTIGILSARERHRRYFQGGNPFTNYLQISAPINHGNSGGPTFDVYGRVIGVNTLASYSSPTGGSFERDESIGFAIPASTVKFVVAGLKDGRLDRGLLGAFLTPVSYEVAESVGLKSPSGAFVSSVVPDSPADVAGLQPGDIIMKVNGQVVKDEFDCLQKISTLPVGSDVTLTVWRQGQTVTVKVTLRNREILAQLDFEPAIATLNAPTLGLNLLPELQAGITVQTTVPPGLTIADVASGSEAERLGLRAGDRVVMIGGDKIRSLGDVNLAIEKARASHRPSALIYIQAADGTMTHVVVPLQAK